VPLKKPAWQIPATGRNPEGQSFCAISSEIDLPS
jgi:hypothetical protein